MDLLQRLKDATNHGLTKEDFFRLLDMETKINEQKKAEGSSSVSVSPGMASTQDIRLEDLMKKQCQLQEAFLEMRSTVLNKMEEDKLQMKSMLAQAQQDILKSVSAKLEEEMLLRKDELGQIRKELINDVTLKLNEVRNSVTKVMGQNQSKIMATLSARTGSGTGSDLSKGDKKETTDQQATPPVLPKNQLKKMKKQEAKEQSFFQQRQPQQQQPQQQQPQQQQPQQQQSSTVQKQPLLQYPHPGAGASPIFERPYQPASSMPLSAPSSMVSPPPQLPPPPPVPVQKPSRPRPKKQAKPQIHEHHHYYQPELTEEEKTAEAVKLVVEKIGSAWKNLTNDE